MAGPTPPVSVLIPVWNGAAALGPALRSVLGQTVAAFELVVVDDGSDDETPDLLARVEDPRLRVVRSEQRLGVAGALGLGLEVASGEIVARMDADDVAEPGWLGSLLQRLDARPRVAVVGGGLVELPPDGAGAVHLLPQGVALTRWRALFGTPFFHNAVAFRRSALDAAGGGYDPALEGVEDFDLWARMLRVVDGDTVPRALVRYRSHPAQASALRADRLLALRRTVALRELALVAPGVTAERLELAWRAGDARPIAPEAAGEAVDALLDVLTAVEAGGRHGRDPAVRAMVARDVARVALHARSPSLARRAASLDPTLPLAVLRDRRSRRREGQRVERRRAAQPDLPGVLRVTAVSPEPTPYRAPLFDLVARAEGVELTVVYASASVQQRTWTVDAEHAAVTLEGRRLPGARTVLRHDYPVTTGIVTALRRSAPDVVVVSGWSTFASQAAVAWCRRTRTPYVLHVESNDRDARPGWRRAVKATVADRVVAGAAWTLVVGSLARDSVIARGADPARVSVFANTIDVEAFGGAAEALAPRRPALRAELGIGDDDVAVLCVARLAPEKGCDTLLRAAAEAGRSALVVVLAGGGPEQASLERLGRELGVRVVIPGELPWERIAERYVAADAFALLSTHEPWGVVVNEAAACGLPLVLSDRVGAAHDLLDDGVNGVLVPVGDVAASAAALRQLVDDPPARHAAGAASRAIVAGWGYAPMAGAFLDAVRAAATTSR